MKPSFSVYDFAKPYLYKDYFLLMAERNFDKDKNVLQEEIQFMLEEIIFSRARIIVRWCHLAAANRCNKKLDIKETTESFLYRLWEKTENYTSDGVALYLDLSADDEVYNRIKELYPKLLNTETLEEFCELAEEPLTAVQALAEFYQMFEHYFEELFDEYLIEGLPKGFAGFVWCEFFELSELCELLFMESLHTINDFIFMI